MNIKFKNIYRSVLLVLILFCISFSSYAVNEIHSASDELSIKPITDKLPENFVEKDNIPATISELTEEEIVRIVEEHNKEIVDAIASVTGIEPAIFPTLLHQQEFHPGLNDTFGINNDTTPIFRVMVDRKDKEDGKKIALTFDSAYINDYTYTILDILDTYDVKATFFMTHEFMCQNPVQIIEIIHRGHEIGNHTTTHPDLNNVSDAKLAIEVMKCHNFLKYLTGVNMCLFRFPFGSYSPRTVTMLKMLGYYPIQWTVDSIDWKNESKEAIVRRVTESDLLIPGSIFLFHNGATYTPEALPEILEFIKKKGLKPCKVSDLIFKHDFYLDRGKQYKKGAVPSDTNVTGDVSTSSDIIATSSTSANVSNEKDLTMESALIGY